ncbi:MAG: sulfur carrier protein ThiS [Thermoleophilaceae bacterium]|jgi:sulfur carrier protein|nr:sulfur carrier protein ThiS [Thermoleophilaceae bacterium]
MPTVTLNGEEHPLPDGATAADAVHAAGAAQDGRGVAVAVDGEVVARGHWADAPLPDGARVEVLRAVQGGC